MDWPAYSPDLNPIERVCDMLGRRIAARQPPPTCLLELRRALLDEWCNIPQDQIDNLILSMPRRSSIELADSNFHMPGQIDILIGSELFFEILNPEQYYLQEGNVILQNTKFGYLVTGTLPQSQQQANCCLISEPSLDITVKKFFELESLPDDSKEITKSEEEIYCEEHFVSTYKRDKTGRFIVRLPIKENAETLLGYSKENAIKRLNGIWEKLNKNNTMGTLYKEFMNEYELLGHMEEIKNETLDKINYYIPHHSVYKPEKTSTPLRVVFDASAKTSGFSLNSILLNGGIIQQDLFSIVSRFRKHEYAFSADIKKMYRQILVDPNQRDLQRIMWKTSADAPVKTYKLATITYGTVSAPFLATRTLRALADEEKAEFPDAANVICNDSYMDDILSGESTLEGAKKLQTRLSQLLQRGGFELHKWVSNSPELLKDLSASSYVFDKEFQDAPVKTLGMLWDPKVDCLTYKVRVSDKVNFSKRDVLSEIARLYDPLGLIGPIVTKAKIFIQELWKIKLDWSEQLPPEAMEEWVNFYQKLAKVNNFKIPRCILLPATIRIEIHGFSDASERAYAAVVYIKCFNEAGQSQTRLLCSKSRVAPLKTLTIPRLELSAALLLSRLVKKVELFLQLSIHKIWMWTNSTIALAWIKTEPHKLKTFVSNRVAEIQALSKDYHWKHVSSKNNPADLISRGCNVDELLKNEVWFSGPDLQTDEYEDNQLFPDPSYRDELKCAVTLSMTECSSNFYDELFNVTNNFIKLIRIFSFIFRFINNIKAKESCNKEKYLTADEVKRSTEFLAKIAQLSEFKAEIDALKKVKVFQKQQRNKWQFEKNNVAVGCLVLVKENDLPPCKWTMARILEVIYGTDGKVGITFQEGDRFNSCQVIYSQFGLAIHQNDHQARRRFVEWAQNEIAVVPDFHKRILFSDEAHFWLNGYVNKQNCRIWSEANPQVHVETPLHPEKLTVWCALWAGGIIGPYFFKNDEGHNVTVNGDRYRVMITNFFIHELNNHDVQELWFQQDGATCHTARATIDLLKETFGDRLISRFGPVID
ncbi:integrase catalytic domain-containing protein [Trichonephila clavipes]|nr:integrase catalytic domain-containing protein [Trichonephila clavipes]